ncbi:MAG: DUF1896 family protein [Parabacteroides gordonii]|jgi:hypothetical protein|uniref:DUF1896 family protein n=1 Tax=Parabacteroides gordonii TaxID=574930 RepID=UPI00359C6CA3
MNDKNKSAEFSYYGLYLLKYLKENHPDRVSDTDFIEGRADHAADVYEQSRLEGATPEGAQELAMAALLQGLHFSKYNTVIEVLWNEFADEVPPGDAPVFALTLLPATEEVFARYPLADGFAYTPEYDLLYTELTGTVAIYLEEHGI